MKTFSANPVLKFRIVAAGGITPLSSNPAATIRMHLSTASSVVLELGGLIAVVWMMLSPIPA